MHLPSSQQMQMQMIDSLSAVGAGVDHQAKTIVEMLQLSDFIRCEEEFAQKLSLSRGRMSERSEVLLGDDQDMHRCLWVDVREREHMVVLVEACDRDHTAGDLAEEAIGVCSHVRMLNLRGYFLKYLGSIPGIHGL